MIFRALLALAFAATVVGTAPPARAGQVLVASDRCNGRMIDDYSQELRDLQARPPRGDQGSLARQFGKVEAVLNSLNEERGIIDSVCASDEAKAPLFAQLAVTAAQGLLTESDLALKLNLPCPPAANAFAQQLVAQAWLNIANVVNETGSAPPRDITEAAAPIQARATALGMTLPAFAETSAYWRDGFTAKAKDAVLACPSPSPSASPSPIGEPPFDRLRVTGS